MLDTNEVAQRPRGRAEVLGGVVRRRRWTVEEKGRIVAEAISPGVVVSRVARRHDLAPQHLSNWIRDAKSGRLALPEDGAMAFVPVVAEQGRTAVGILGQIEILAGSLVIRIPLGCDARVVESVLRALKRT